MSVGLTISALGALAAATILVVAARRLPRGPIVPAPLTDLRRHVLLVSRQPLEDAETLAQLARLCAGPDPEEAAAKVRLLVPRTRSRLDRWSGERRPAQALAQRRCVLSLAALATAGLGASAGVGDENLLLAVEDELHTFPATDVVLLTGAAEDEEEEAVAELRERLQADFLHLPAAAAPARRAAGRTRVS